ncbi:MAG: MoaD/ThiS family protein [Chloroflexi bacterium]|nr:MAG: MoaD/ThiS family protein [Chloroflexota bacterium]
MASSIERIHIDVWLYGPLARYGGDPSQKVFANLPVELAEDSTVSDLLSYLQMPSKERGITFINGELSALPDVQPDLDKVLNDGDRVAFFHLQSMWPFQYRLGAPAIEEIQSGLKLSSTGKPKE